MINRAGRSITSLVLSLFAVAFAGVSVPAAAGEDSKKVVKRIPYDHLKREPSVPFKVRLTHAEMFEVMIENTAEARFRYEIKGFKPVEVESTSRISGPINEKDLAAVTLRQVHNKIYGGYTVEIVPIDGAVDVIDDQGNTMKEKLDKATVTIIVLTQTWDYEVAGAFTVSDLVDPVYAARDDGSGQDVVVRERKAEDSQSLGLAAMVHVFHAKYPDWAMTFGLGINDDSKTSYYIGPSFRFGDRAAVTLGYNWGSIDRLPSGVREGDPINDPNALGNLDSRVDGRVFVGLSYTFLNPGDALQKPFAGAETDSQAAASTPN